MRHTSLVGEWSVTGNDDVGIECGNQVACGDPILERPRPHDRSTTDEQDVAGVDGLGLGTVHDCVALGVRGADLDQFNDASAHVDVEPAVKSARWRCEFDSRKVEVTEERPEQVPDVAICSVQRGHHRGWNLAHLVRSRTRGNDLGTIDELISVAVVAVGMRVDDRPDRRTTGDATHRPEHRLGQAQVEERVDEE